MTKNTHALVAALLGLCLQTGASATLLYDADNEGFLLGATPPTTGPLDAPTSIDPNLDITVEDGTTVVGPSLGPDKFLRLGENPGEAPDFRYDVGSDLTSGVWTVSMDLLFESLENYHVYFRESGSAAVNVADIRFTEGGGVTVSSKGGVSTSTYAADIAYQLVAELDLDAEVMDLFLNGVQIATDQAIDDVFGSATIGFDFTSFSPQSSGFSGMMQVDNFRVAEVPVAGVPVPGVPALIAIGLAALAGGRRRSA